MQQLAKPRAQACNAFVPLTFPPPVVRSSLASEPGRRAIRLLRVLGATWHSPLPLRTLPLCFLSLACNPFERNHNCLILNILCLFLLGLARHKKGKLGTMDRAVLELLPDKSFERNLVTVI